MGRLARNRRFLAARRGYLARRTGGGDRRRGRRRAQRGGGSLIKLTGLDGKPLYVEPTAVVAIMPAMQSMGPGTIGRPVGSSIVLGMGAQIVATETPEEVATMVETARPPKPFSYTPD